MCWTLYISTTIKLPLIEWDSNQPRFNARKLKVDELAIVSRFTMPEVVYLGSDQGCGCGFRHALLAGKEWYPIVEEDNDTMEVIQKNHEDLYQYLTDNVKSGFIEIYGCWNGDITDSIDCVDEISIKDLTDKDFYFKEGWLYKVLV
jgi:hypothetical protein